MFRANVADVGIWRRINPGCESIAFEWRDDFRCEEVLPFGEAVESREPGVFAESCRRRPERNEMSKLFRFVSWVIHEMGERTLWGVMIMVGRQVRGKWWRIIGNDEAQVAQSKMASMCMIEDGHLGGYIKGGDVATWYPTLWRWLVRRYGITSVLDVGCGEGHSTRFFQDLGCTVLGLEGCQQAIDESVIRDRLVQHDFCKGPYRMPEPCDLVWSCEFVEHVDEQYVGNIIDTFANSRKIILITHAGPGQVGGHHHVNLKPAEYWIRLIEGKGYRYSRALTRKTRTIALKDSYYDYPNHYAERGLVFTCRE